MKPAFINIIMRLLKQFALLILLIPLSIHADDLDDGQAAYLAKEYEKALNLLKPLAEGGNSEAQVTVGIMYDYGHGVTANPEEAFKWYKMAAEQGIPVVQHDLGVKYFQGIGTEQNYKEAAKWWEMSSNAGLADSQFNLGLLYYRGLGLEQNFDKARPLFEKAANQGHGHAQYSLAVMHAFGQGVDKDYKKALDWFRKSANQDIAQAQFNLGVFYENGYGVTANIDTAREWYQKASDQNLSEAQEKLKELLLAEQKSNQPVATETVAVAEPASIEPKQYLESNESSSLKLDTGMEKDTSPEHPVSFPGDIKREDWVMAQQTNIYTVQISSSTSEKGIIKFLKDNNLQSNSAYIKVFVKGETRYSALYGSFSTYTEAEQAINSLPEHIQASEPWVRNFGKLQRLLEQSQG